LVYWVTPISTKAKDTYYSIMYAGGRSGFTLTKPAYINGRWVAKGTKIKGYQGRDFMGKAISTQQAGVLETIDKEMGIFLNKLWNG
jgi:hypothetical protein